MLTFLLEALNFGNSPGNPSKELKGLLIGSSTQNPDFAVEFDSLTSGKVPDMGDPCMLKVYIISQSTAGDGSPAHLRPER